jgi:hypothetical protein
MLPSVKTIRLPLPWTSALSPNQCESEKFDRTKVTTTALV